jgi:hypothetical protein
MSESPSSQPQLCPIYEQLVKSKTKRSRRPGDTQNPKPKQKSKAEIHNEKVETKLDEIKAEIKSMNDKFLEEVRNIRHDAMVQMSNCLQGHDTNNTQLIIINNYFTNIQNQNLDLGLLPPLNTLYIDKK